MADISEDSADLKGLKEHQLQIKSWMNKVQRKIFELETSYLEETSMGNLIKGWEIDGRPPLKSRGQYDEKERLFSYSNHLAYEVKAADANNSARHSNLANKHKKNKKRKLEGGDDYIPGDY